MRIAADINWLKMEKVPYISRYTFESLTKAGVNVSENSIFIVDSESERYVRTDEDLEKILDAEFATFRVEDIINPNILLKGVCYLAENGCDFLDSFDHVVDIEREDFTLLSYYRLCHEVAKIRTINAVLVVSK